MATLRSMLVCGTAICLSAPALAQVAAPPSDPAVAPPPQASETGAKRIYTAADFARFAPKTAYDVINQCLLLHGQYGYRTELPIEQRLRDVLGLQIGDGTAQIMKLIIARQRLGRALAP